MTSTSTHTTILLYTVFGLHSGFAPHFNSYIEDLAWDIKETEK